VDFFITVRVNIFSEEKKCAAYNYNSSQINCAANYPFNCAQTKQKNQDTIEKSQLHLK
jgi:hypothetical protein